LDRTDLNRAKPPRGGRFRFAGPARGEEVKFYSLRGTPHKEESRIQNPESRIQNNEERTRNEEPKKKKQETQNQESGRTNTKSSKSFEYRPPKDD
jgi:hypothetical protein